MPSIWGHLQFDRVALLSTMYWKFVHWLQVSMKYHSHDGRLTFTAVMLATYLRIGILVDLWLQVSTKCHSIANHILVYWYTHWLCQFIFVFQFLQTILKSQFAVIWPSQLIPVVPYVATTVMGQLRVNLHIAAFYWCIQNEGRQRIMYPYTVVRLLSRVYVPISYLTAHNVAHICILVLSFIISKKNFVMCSYFQNILKFSKFLNATYMQ